MMPEESRNSPSWLIYERCVAAFMADKFSDLDTIVQHNAMIKGHLSGTNRQIDVLVEQRLKTKTSKRLVVDAKFYERPLNINDVEQFEGLMKDVQANDGVLVCNNSYSKAAQRRAQDAITIQILSLEEALKSEWDWESCYGKCASLNKDNSGLVLWEQVQPLGADSMWLLIQTGKCDVCHSFHVWCQDCGIKFAVPDKHVVRCGCGYFWASVPESEETGYIGVPESIWLMMRTDLTSVDQRPTYLDRKPIR